MNLSKTTEGFDLINESNILLETGTNELEILEFYINLSVLSGSATEPCYFGMNVAKVMEVIESPRIEPSNHAPHPCFLGVIPLRGMVLPVIDISTWLGLPRVKNEYENVIVTEFSQTVTGFLVSGVTEICRVGWKQVIAPTRFISRLSTGSIIGTVEMKNHFIQLLDLEYIISDLNPDAAMETWKTTVRSEKQYTALVVEDSETIRMIMKKNLTAANFKVHMVNNGEEALPFFEELKNRATETKKKVSDYLDIIICDIEMPQMDGFTLTKNVKEDPVLQKLPVILYSSIITDELRHKGESVKADVQISKPEMDKMAESAIHLIEGRQQVFS